MLTVNDRHGRRTHAEQIRDEPNDSRIGLPVTSGRPDPDPQRRMRHVDELRAAPTRDDPHRYVDPALTGSPPCWCHMNSLAPNAASHMTYRTGTFGPGLRRRRRRQLSNEPDRSRELSELR